MPAASKESATDENPLDEAGQESPQGPPSPIGQQVHQDDNPPPNRSSPTQATNEPPASQMVYRYDDLPEKMQAAILACAINFPEQFREFWKDGGRLFDLIGMSLFHVGSRFLRESRTLSLTAIHQKCRAEIKKQAADEVEREEKWDSLDDFVSLIEQVVVNKELPYVQEHIESWLRSCRHDTALNVYAHAVMEARDQKEVVLRRAELIRALKDMDAPPGANNGQHFTITTLEEIMKDDGKPPDWVIENLMPAVGVATMSGRAKEGKTWAALDLCLSVASGTEWLRFKTKKGKACYVNFELGSKTLHSRIKNIAAAKNIELTDMKGRLLPLTIDTGGLLAAALEQEAEDMFTSLVLEQVRRGLEKASMPQPSIIVLDSFYNFTGRLNENDAADVGMVYHLVRKMANDLNCMVVIIHHFAKGSPGEKLQGDRAAGSRVHRQEPNTYIELAPHKDDGALVFSVDLRDYPPVPKFCLRFEFPLFEAAPELDPEDLKRPSQSGNRDSLDPKDVMSLLLDGPLEPKEWLNATIRIFKRSESTFHRARRALVRAKKVRKVGQRWELSQPTDSSRTKCNATT